MDSDTLAKLKVECIVLRYPDVDCKFMKDQSYQDEVDLIVRDERRNKFIVDLTKHLTGNTLVLFQFVEKHGDVLHTMINKSLTDRKVFYVYGGTDTQTREEIRAITEKEKDAVIVASYGTFSTGINIRNLHNIVFSSPSKSRIRVLQSVGVRCDLVTIRTQDRLVDIVMILLTRETEFYFTHFMERINIYNEEEFDYDIKQISIDKG